jgi:hypothetical protein
MTVHEPAGDPTLLEALVRKHADRVLHIVSELRRSPDMPGVPDDLAAALEREAVRFLNTEAAVVHPHVEAALGLDERRGLEDEARRIAALVRQGPDRIPVDVVEALLRDHAGRLARDLADLVERMGSARLAALGYAYCERLEAAPDRRLVVGGGSPPVA